MRVRPDSPGHRLRLLRLRLGKTQQAFADELGVSGSTLSRYEKNMRGPDTYFFHLLRMKTGVDLNWLLGGEGEMFPVVPGDLVRKQSLARRIISHTNEITQLLQELQKF